MLAETFAILIVTFAIAAPGAYLLRVAWRRGGIAKWFAIAACIAAGTLILWLYGWRQPEMSTEERITAFAGAWGILFMIVGFVAMAAALIGRSRFRRPDDRNG